MVCAILASYAPESAISVEFGNVLDELNVARAVLLVSREVQINGSQRQICARGKQLNPRRPLFVKYDKLRSVEFGNNVARF
jgi:hypothetical protein